MLAAGAFVRAARGHESAGIGCEDSALAESSGARAFAAVCDGCSSGEDSGLASKALARSALAQWREGAQCGEDLARSAWARAAGACSLSGMDASLSPSTLLMAEVASVAGGLAIARLSLWGDGAVALAGADGGLLGLWAGASEKNMPAYPAYAFDDGLWARFEGQGGSCSWERLWEAEGAAQACFARAGRGWEARMELAPGACLYLLSDGIMAVEGVAPVEAARALCSGKGPGDFWRRRARKAIDDWEKGGARLGDDVGLACVRSGVQGEG